MGEDTDEQIKDLKASVTKLEADAKTAQETNDEEKKKEVKEARKATILQAVSFMGEEAYAKYKAAIDASGNAELKAAMDEVDKEKEKTAKKGQTDEEKKKDEQTQASIKALEAKLADPIIVKMLSAREDAGMEKDNLKEYEKTLRAKSLQEIEGLYNSEKILIEQLSASNPVSEETERIHFPFTASVRNSQFESVNDILGDNN